MTEQNAKIGGRDRGPDAPRHDGGHGRARTGARSASAEGEGKRHEKEKRKSECATKRRGAK